MRLSAYPTAILILLFLFLVTGFTPWQASVAAQEPAASQENPEEEATDESLEEESEESSLFQYNGFIEFQSYFNTYEDQDFSDASKKNELRTRFESRYGEDNLHLFVAADLFYQILPWKDDAEKDYRYAEESRVKRNLRITSEDGEAAFNELYLNFGREGYRLRLGNQIYSWGTADGINATSYFNAYDLREFVFRDDDEFRFGVPSLSGMVFRDNYTVELVFVPIHIPARLAPENNYWSVRQDSILYNIHFEETDGIDIKVRNFAYGGRISSSLKGNDFSFSAYHGPDREPVLVPTGVQTRSNLPVSVNIEHRYYVVDYVGMDFSRTIDDFVVQTEVAFSPNKPNIMEQDKPFMDVRFPYEVERSSYISYAAGFNYFIPLHHLIEDHEGESVFTFEWFQSRFFEEGVSQPFLFNSWFTFRYEDSFYHGHIPVSFTTLLETEHNGKMFKPEIGWDFLNGMSVELTYVKIFGNKDTSDLVQNSYYNYRNNDMVMINLRYEY